LAKQWHPVVMFFVCCLQSLGLSQTDEISQDTYFSDIFQAGREYVCALLYKTSLTAPLKTHCAGEVFRLYI